MQALRAGNFYGRVGNVISPFQGMSGAALRGTAQMVALGNLGNACDYANVGAAAGSALTSAVKVPGWAGSLVQIGGAVVGAACPSTSAATTTPTQQTSSSDAAQLALMQQQMAQMTQIQAQQQAQQQALSSFGSRTPATSKSGLAAVKTETWLYVGGAVALAAAGYFLLRK